jgi:hypothetical protein
VEERFYLDFLPTEFKSVIRKHKCKYDVEKHQWYATDKNKTIANDLSNIVFWALMNDLGVSYGKKNKCWDTFYSNEKIDKKYFL